MLKKPVWGLLYPLRNTLPSLGKFQHLCNLIFKIKKRIIRIIMKARNKDSCRPLFRQLNILPFYSQYILSVSIFVVNNLDIFKFNSAIHSINTRQGSNLHLPTDNLAKVQKGVYYSGIRIFSNLPQNIKTLSNDVNKFKQALKKFLLVGSFYFLSEFFEWKTKGDLGSYK
jgi:hypothetical protein